MTRKFNALPGFGLTLGVTLTYASLVILMPIAALLLRATDVSWAEFWRYATDPRAVAAYRLTFGAALAAALVNAFFGSILAWVLVRYRFPGRQLMDALVDIPFALPTAVAGLTLADLFSAKGWLGRFLAPWGIESAYSTLGVIIALTFVSLPFMVRTLQPVIDQLEREVEEAAATLGASRWTTVTRILIPTLLPTLITGFALAFARAIGEYGSVIFISSNLPGKGEIAPSVIVSFLDQFEYRAATVLAVVLLVLSFGMLALINGLERWASRIHR
jgi:sulfate/thiosulfate transport system permease protein